MTTWAVWASGEYLFIDTPNGERRAYMDPYERGGYAAPLDVVSAVALRDLVRALRFGYAYEQFMARGLARLQNQAR